MQTPTIKSLDKFLCLKRADLLALCKRKKITNCRKFRRSEIITILTHYDTTNRREWVRAKKVGAKDILDHYNHNKKSPRGKAIPPRPPMANHWRKL